MRQNLSLDLFARAPTLITAAREIRLTITEKGYCIKLSAQTAGKNVRFLLSPAVNVRCIARSAFQSARPATLLKKDPTPEELKLYTDHYFKVALLEAKKFLDTAPETLFVFAAGNDGTNNDIFPTTPTNVVAENKISSRAAKDILGMIVVADESPLKIADEKDLLQKNDEGDLKEIAQKVIDANAKVVENYKSGKENAIMSLVGAIMKETKGSANPAIALKILKELLG